MTIFAISAGGVMRRIRRYKVNSFKAIPVFNLMTDATRRSFQPVLLGGVIIRLM